MFYNASAFTQRLCWNLEHLSKFDSMFTASNGCLYESCVKNNAIVNDLTLCSTSTPTIQPSPFPSKLPTLRPTLANRLCPKEENCSTPPSTKLVHPSPLPALLSTLPPTMTPSVQATTIRPTHKPTNQHRAACPSGDKVIYTNVTRGKVKCSTPTCVQDGVSIGTPFFIKGCGCGCLLN
jgi:hypothetical protein